MNRRELATSAGLFAGLIALLPRRSVAQSASRPGLALIDRLVEAINSRDLSKLDQIYAGGSEYTNHQVLEGAPSATPAREEFKSYLTQRIKAFPDLTFRYDVAFASEDMVAVNLIWTGTQEGDYLGVAPTMKKVTWNSTDLFRVKNGLFSDHWGAVDLYGLQRQLRG
jgi:predicted ester cyclase